MTTKTARKPQKGRTQAATTDGRLLHLSTQLHEARDEITHLRGIIAGKDQIIESLRGRVIRAASGQPTCARCAEEIRASAPAIPSPPLAVREPVVTQAAPTVAS